ncbi:MAG: FAD-dependent oxidoreductase [Lachnospiraceae bacterium]|nr:FAD-dependent oxidoreductase [Lachnospiraceae bacterium]
MIRVTGIKLAPEEGEDLLLSKICKKLRLSEKDIQTYQIIKKSIDARKKEAPFWVYQVDVTLNRREETILRGCKGPEIRMVQRETYQFPKEMEGRFGHRPVIAGTGPAGLFCGYMLAKAGFAPILLERGGPIQEREVSVRRFWDTGLLDTECNVQFGEGGAGTFSDGKLNTLIKDPLFRGRKVLETFVAMGAGEEILYDSKPHIGTDVLKKVLRNLRKEMEALGAEFHFHTKLVDLELSGRRLSGVFVEDTKSRERRLLQTEHLVLAIGHSARDTFRMLWERQLSMHAKAFAVGLRVEHPQDMIQMAQYGKQFAGFFPPAPYKVTARASDGRGVYSFCMCPGGYVVNASSEQGRLAVNGMSNRNRDGRNANSAIIVTVSPEDFRRPCSFDSSGSVPVHPLAGVEFQRRLEERAFLLGNGAVPVQLYGDFQADRKSSGPGEILPDTMGSNCYTNLRGILPDFVDRAIIEGIDFWGQKIPGFDRYDAVLSGVESRTSSPVRMERNEELESSIPGIYPCGEGAGYAGGITSAAMDGIRVAEAIAARGGRK